MGDLGVNRITLNAISEKQFMKVRTAINWLKIEFNGGLL
jgi:hypothetical protein